MCLARITSVSVAPLLRLVYWYSLILPPMRMCMCEQCGTASKTVYHYLRIWPAREERRESLDGDAGEAAIHLPSQHLTDGETSAQVHSSHWTAPSCDIRRPPIEARRKTPTVRTQLEPETRGGRAEGECGTFSLHHVITNCTIVLRTRSRGELGYLIMRTRMDSRKERITACIVYIEHRPQQR